MKQINYNYIPDIILRNFGNEKGIIFLFSKEKNMWSKAYKLNHINFSLSEDDFLISPIVNIIKFKSNKELLEINEILNKKEEIDLIIYLSIMQIVTEDVLSLNEIYKDNKYFYSKIENFTKCKWFIINNNTNLNLILTDKLIVENPEKTMVILPLGKRKLLIGLKEEEEIIRILNNKSKKSKKEFIYYINKLQCLNYKNHIFSDNNNEGLKNFIVKFSYLPLINNLKKYEDSIFIKVLKLFNNPEKDIPYKPEDKEKIIEEILKRKKENK